MLTFSKYDDDDDDDADADDDDDDDNDNDGGDDDVILGFVTFCFRSFQLQ